MEVKTIKFKNSIRGRCFDYEDRGVGDTAGNPTKVRVCFCGTTACQVLGEIKGYPLPVDFKKVEKEVKIK